MGDTVDAHKNEETQQNERQVNNNGSKHLKQVRFRLGTMNNIDSTSDDTWTSRT